MKHTIQIHLDNDQIYFAFLRKKSEYSARTWSQMIYKICNMPVQSELNEENQARCDQLYQVIGKAKKYNISPDSELVKNCQDKAQDIINMDQQRRKTLDELISKRDELMELVDDPDLNETRHKQCLEMLVLMNQVIEDEKIKLGT